MDNERCCGNCKYSDWQRNLVEFTCMNEDSDCYMCATFYDGSCEVYEEKE